MEPGHEQTSLLWAQRDGTIFRVWITSTVLPRSTGEPVGPAIHFADPEWQEVGSTPVAAGVELWHLTTRDLEDLLRRATGRE